MSTQPINIQQYQQNIEGQWKASREARESRREQGWQLAHQASRLLKHDFHVTKVVVFGSLTQPNYFTQWSDVDLAAWGLTSKNWLQAILAVYELSTEIELNLVDVRNCSADIIEKIEREGTELCLEDS